MPVKTTYPGVYIQELPSGQNSIVPASTSVTAFLGRAPFGPTNQAMTLNSFGDFQTLFGGLSSNYPLSYAVHDYFQNGGSVAVIVRLFEPTSVTDSGVAQLVFPPELPPVPDGWMLAAAPVAGQTQLLVTPPSGGSEGEPMPGMTLQIGTQKTVYTVVHYNSTGTAGPTLTITPPLAAGPNNCERCELTFGLITEPAGWTIAPLSEPTSIVIGGGTGVPQLGDFFQFANDPQQLTYTIMAEPTVAVGPSGTILVTIGSFTPAIPNTSLYLLAVGGQINFSEPTPSPFPVGWSVPLSGSTPASGMAYIVNGAGNPMPFDTFTAGSSNVYIVSSYVPPDHSKSPPIPASIKFGPAPGNTWPPPSTDFGVRQTLSFLPRNPSGYTIETPPSANGNLMVVGTNSATVGPIVVGDMFTVQGDETVYIVRTFDPTSNRVQFLPAAATVFSGLITFSVGLTLQAASPGLWGNGLTAIVDTTGITARTAASSSIAQYQLEQVDLFNLTLVLKSPSNQILKQERYTCVSVRTDGAAGNYPNRLDRVLQTQSTLATIAATALPLLPPAGGAVATGGGGDDGTYLKPPTYLGDSSAGTGIYMLATTPINLLCIPPDYRLVPSLPLSLQNLDPAVIMAAAEYCTLNRAIFIADPPALWSSLVANGETESISPKDLGISGTSSTGIEYERNVAVYFPRIWEEDVLTGTISLFPACGAIAGAIAASDGARGVWKAPAGTGVGLAGVTSLEVNMTDGQNEILNPLGINCLRTFPLTGTVIWGARTLISADILQDDYKYLSVRRLTLFIESSIYQSTQWAVFEPNTEALWSSLRLSVSSFLAGLAQQGAFYNYAVTCDATNNTPATILRGQVNILVQIAPVDPAEFIVIQIQQVAPQLAS